MLFFLNQIKFKNSATDNDFDGGVSAWFNAINLHELGAYPNYRFLQVVQFAPPTNNCFKSSTRYKYNMQFSTNILMDTYHFMSIFYFTL